MKNPCVKEKRSTAVEHTELGTTTEPDLWRSFESFVSAGNTNRPVTEWCNPSKAPPTGPLKYGTPQRYKFIGDEAWSRLI